MSLQTPEDIRRLQRTLYVKAKNEPAYRFYLLYDKVCREDILLHAYWVSRAARGAPGVDGVTFAASDAAGAEEWLSAYGYRPKRSAQHAVQAVHDALCDGYTGSVRNFVCEAG